MTATDGCPTGQEAGRALETFGWLPAQLGAGRPCLHSPAPALCPAHPLHGHKATRGPSQSVIVPWGASPSVVPWTRMSPPRDSRVGTGSLPRFSFLEAAVGAPASWLLPDEWAASPREPLGGEGGPCGSRMAAPTPQADNSPLCQLNLRAGHEVKGVVSLFWGAGSDPSLVS